MYWAWGTGQGRKADRRALRGKRKAEERSEILCHQRNSYLKKERRCRRGVWEGRKLLRRLGVATRKGGGSAGSKTSQVRNKGLLCQGKVDRANLRTDDG